MREYKFRAWDEEESKMIEWYDEFFSDMSPVTRCSAYFSFIDMELMQYTGLKDVDGKEIYEGDLHKDDENFIWEVTFNNGTFCAECSDLMARQPLNRFMIGFDNFKVIGNKFENKELLEVEQ